MLISIERIQQATIAAILHKLPELSILGTDAETDDKTHVSLPRLILNQLRWLDCLASPKVIY